MYSRKLALADSYIRAVVHKNLVLGGHSLCIEISINISFHLKNVYDLLKPPLFYWGEGGTKTYGGVTYVITKSC
jgi:hypothetical protein